MMMPPGADQQPSLIIDIRMQGRKWKSKGKDWESLIEAASTHTLAAVPVLSKLQRAELSVLLTTDKDIQALNRDFLGKNKPTNVLSFPAEILTPSKRKLPSELYLGDVALAYETLAREARAQHKTLEHHAIHLLVHGILHLCGYDHESVADAKKMAKLEISILENLSISNPYI